MADVITRFKLETTQYDSKLRDASKALADYTRQASVAGSEFGKYTQKNVEAARAFGNIATSATNSKDKVKELVGAFNDVARQYNMLTKEQQQSDFGKALAESMTTLKGRISEAKTEMNSTGGILGQLKDKFTINIDALKLFNIGVQGAKAALDVAKDAFMKSEGGIDEWGRTVKGAEATYDTFLLTLNNGSWSDFFANLSDAVKGARDLYDAFDRLNSIKANNQVAIAMTQAEIAQLRLLKQQGQDVDDKIKAATQRLAALQNQGTQAGITAGKLSVQTTLRNRINTIEGGRGLISDKSLNYISEQIAKGGQKIFDTAKWNAEQLARKAKDTRTVTTGSSATGLVTTQETFINLRNLSEEERRQYVISKAITDSETEIQTGLSVWAGAIREKTGNLREEFKGNRYALQGAGGGSGGGGKGGGSSTTPTYDVGSLAEAQAEVQRLGKLWNEAGADVRDQYLQPLIEAEKKVKDMQNAMNLQKERAQGRLLEDKAVEVPIRASVSDSIVKSIDDIRAELAANPIVIPIESATKDVKALQESARTTAQVVGTIGTAFNAIENPAAKVAGVVAQAIANVALAYSDALAKTEAEKFNIWSFIAAAAASTVSMVSTIASIHSATGYANGGEIKGNTYSGDQIPILANAGEIVLNAAGQRNVAASLQGNNLRGMSLKTKVKGTELLVWLDNSLAQSGRGELVTWGQ